MRVLQFNTDNGAAFYFPPGGIIRSTITIDRTEDNADAIIAKLPPKLQRDIRTLWHHRSRFQLGFVQRVALSVELIEIRPRPDEGYMCLNVWVTHGVYMGTLIGFTNDIIRSLTGKRIIKLERIDRHQLERIPELLRAKHSNQRPRQHRRRRT